MRRFLIGVLVGWLLVNLQRFLDWTVQVRLKSGAIFRCCKQCGFEMLEVVFDVQHEDEEPDCIVCGARDWGYRTIENVPVPGWDAD